MRDGRRALRCCLLAAVAMVVACDKRAPPRPSEATAKAPASIAPPVSSAHAPRPWRSVSVEQAFVQAREEGKLVFLYWGARWCPPCNELEAEVFSRPRFAELTRGFVALHLDGDTEAAQREAEALSVSAYPTMLVLSPAREELLRLNGGVDLDELERALGALRGEGRSFRAAIERLEAGKPSEADCAALAHAAWELLPAPAWGRARVLASLERAVKVCPSSAKRERALLSATLLGLASSYRRDAELETVCRGIEAGARGHLDLVFADAESSWAARAFVNHRAADLAAWLDPDRAGGPSFEAWKAKWLAAAASNRAREGAPVEIRLFTVNPALDFFRHASPEGPLPEPLRAEVVSAVARADRDARSAASRHAVVSGAAYLLRRIGAHDEARKMLLAEAGRSDTPFYYHSMLAALEQELGRIEEARAFSRKAREGAAGRATRLQWITNDILFHAKLEPPPRGYLLGLAGEFYELAFSLGDGFYGRNRTRADQVRGALEVLGRDPEYDKLLARLAERCASLPSADRGACRQHFSR